MANDNLTGALTERAFCDVLADRRTGALLYINIVSLRFSNAVHGPNATDNLLVETTELLKKTCPSGLVARLGGSEFAVFVERTEDAPQLAQMLRTLFDTQFAEERASIRAGASEAGVINPPSNFLTLRIGAVSLADHPDFEASLSAAERVAS